MGNNREVTSSLCCQRQKKERVVTIADDCLKSQVEWGGAAGARGGKHEDIFGFETQVETGLNMPRWNALTSSEMRSC